MRRIWQWLVTALLVAIFLSLANWQWNRAEEMKNPPKVDETVFPIDSVISPTSAITSEKIGRKVSVTGKYVSTWIAPNQTSGGKTGSWDVGLFQTKDNAMILVVRGFHQVDTKLDQMREIKVTGYLIPPQIVDVAETVGNQISRVDSALFVTKTQLPLYAPFIQASKEEPDSAYKAVPFKFKTVPGFYWQHISYVIIWSLFAVTAIYLMLYQRRQEKIDKK
jgi:cytochrome oxidase assembly protein ShyY1